MAVANHVPDDEAAGNRPPHRIDGAEMARRRQEMVKEIEDEVFDLAGMLGRRSLDARVIEAMQRVPRHEFVPARLRVLAYENHPLAIGHGQTISQPFMVALMTDLLALEMPARVLEIGTGSGYQAAVLAELGASVYSVEVVEELADTDSAYVRDSALKERHAHWLSALDATSI